VTEPRTHYQISLTSRQAVFLFAGLLVALGGAYFLGLMTGLPSREPQARETPAGAPAAPADRGRAGERESAAGSSDALPPIETAVPTAAVASNAVRAAATPAPAEPTAPPTLQPFDDGSSEEAASPLVEASPGKSPPPAHGGAAHPGAGRYWVQVASLTSRQEASALSGRLSKRGYKSQVLSADGPRGRGRVYRVRVGPYPSEDEAGKAAGKLNKQERIASPWVVPDGK
jgi:cell division septation protein DedD